MRSVQRKYLLLVGYLLFAGCNDSPPQNRASPPIMETPKASLDASYDSGTLKVRLRNVGRVPLVVDKELVFLLHLRAVKPGGADIGVSENSSLPRPGQDVKKRFISLKPGQQVERTIELRKPFVLFRCGSSFSPGPGASGALSAYEALVSLPADANPVKIHLDYRRDFNFHECFLSYTGLEAGHIGLYEGPLEASVETK